MVQPVGLKGRLLGKPVARRLAGPGRLWSALFALSFDTVSQAALFRADGDTVRRSRPRLMLGLVFPIGMLLVAGSINGVDLEN